MATLPDSRYMVRIRDMEIGESAYVVPWAMHADGRGRCWLDGGIATTPQPWSTSDMLIRRTEAGYVVDITTTGYAWPREGVVNTAGRIPVAELVA